MKMFNTFAIAVAIFGLGYGTSFAQSLQSTGPLIIEVASETMSDDDYLAMANTEAFSMFADELTPLAPQDFEKIYILGLGDVSSSFYCAMDVLDKVSEMIGTDHNGLLFVELSDIAPYLGSASCSVSEEVNIEAASLAGS